MPRLHLIRHTKPDVLPGLCYGHLDVPLLASYPRALADVRDQLPDLEPVRVYSSPSQRCLRLANDLNAGPVCVVEALRELNFGSWEGKLWSQIPREESDPWSEDFVNRAPPGGESFRSLHDRVLDFLGGLQWDDAHDILCITHSGVIRAIVCAWNSRHLGEAFDFEVAFGQVVTLPLEQKPC
ncbi:MAG: alpha-ribazole phosphatase family protein [Oligoflexus sp.]|jgi:alpha-ribazole phosphatase